MLECHSDPFVPSYLDGTPQAEAKTQSPRKQKNIHISCCCVFNSLARSHRTPARSASMIIKDNKKEKRTCTQMLSKRINAHGNQKQVSFEKKENRTVTTTAFFSVTTGWRQRARREKKNFLRGVGLPNFFCSCFLSHNCLRVYLQNLLIAFPSVYFFFEPFFVCDFFISKLFLFRSASSSAKRILPEIR